VPHRAVLCCAMQSGGTRGDVQPAAALGVALAAEGARVRFAADASFRPFVGDLPGLEFYPLGGNARDMMGLTVKWG
jgi:UDP:flavonoid glycosyltransferase YjiC (YdhE family)